MTTVVSRTVAQLASLATCSLFATALTIAVANGMRHGTFCTAPTCAVLMAKSDPAGKPGAMSAIVRRGLEV
jgi:hypothetical protein